MTAIPHPGTSAWRAGRRTPRRVPAFSPSLVLSYSPSNKSRFCWNLEGSRRKFRFARCDPSPEQPAARSGLGTNVLLRSIPHLDIMDKTKSKLAAFFDDDEDDGSALPVR